MTLNKNTYVTVCVDTLLPFGSGQGLYKDTPVVIPNTVPGDQVEAKVIKTEPQRVIGKLISIMTPSPHRIEPTCSVAAQCGGCQLQHMDYETQVAHKASLLNSALGDSLSVMPAASPFHYRNKLQMTFGRDTNNSPILGLYASHSNRIVDTELCHIVHPNIQALFHDVRNWMQTQDTLPYHLVIRHGTQSEELMLIFVIPPSHKPLQDAILDSFSHVTSVWVCENDTPDTSVLTPSLTHLHGKTTISDSLLGLRFEVSPISFTQNNPTMTESLYTHVKTLVSTLSAETLWDLYCGIGIMTQVCATEVTTCIGIECIPEAIENATASCEENGIDNCSFICADATDYVDEILPTSSPDVVILDPPRKGCSKALLHALGGKKIAHIIYVSCSPQSLGRDVAILANMGYSIESSLGVDCFPNTVHVEAVVHLKYVGT